MNTPIFLRPVTRLYFGRPGALPAGEAHTGDSWFPPPISAFQGMIRTRLLDEAGIFSPRQRVAKLVGAPDELPQGWQLMGPFPGRRRQGTQKMQMWLPAPAMLLGPIKEPGCALVRAHLPESGADRNSLLMDQGAESGLELLGAPGQDREKPASGWLSCRSMVALLCGAKQLQPGEYCHDLPPFVCRETHTGLAREKGDKKDQVRLPGRAKEGMLYTLSMLRFAPDSGLCGWFSGNLASPLSAKALHRGTVVAGKKGGVIGFARAAGVDPHWQDLAGGKHLAGLAPGESLRIWLILLTPGRWHNLAGLAAMVAEAAGLEPGQVRVRGCLCPPLVYLGGFSMASGRARPARAWYGAGTSLLIDLHTDSGQDLPTIVRKKLNNQCLLAPPAQRPFGYGHVLAAPYQHKGGTDGN